MKRLIVAVLFLTVVLMSNIHASKAVSLPPLATYKLTCNSITITGTPDSDFMAYHSVQDKNTGDWIVDAELQDLSDPYTVTLSFSGNYHVGDPIYLDLDDGNDLETTDVIPPCSGTVCPIFLDGRLNNCDAAETAAIYCLADGSVKVLAIYASKGYDAFIATPAEIAAVPTYPVKNTLIKSGNGAFLYRLTSGELQVQRAEDGTGKTYKFIFKDCTAK